jgi:hypothetical protein
MQAHKNRHSFSVTHSEYWRVCISVFNFPCLKLILFRKVYCVTTKCTYFRPCLSFLLRKFVQWFSGCRPTYLILLYYIYYTYVVWCERSYSVFWQGCNYPKKLTSKHTKRMDLVFYCLLCVETYVRQTQKFVKKSKISGYFPCTYLNSAFRNLQVA